jgi:UDP-N-acetylmuramoyl-L-alanyl-D-glutamate--2,6-diaminopimelate ligase
MVDEGVDYCFIEVSSHALALDRVFGTKIYGAMFTNLSPDHLELHKNMEDYYLAKKKLFFMSENFNIINGDDLWGKRLFGELSDSKADNYSFGLSDNCDFRATDVEYKINEIMYNLNYIKDLGSVNLKIPGKVNVYNSLTAAAFALKDNLPFSIIRKGFLKTKE